MALFLPSLISTIAGTDQDKGHWGTGDQAFAVERGPSHEGWGEGPGVGPVQ